jgi:predicted transcriptional regulator
MNTFTDVSSLRMCLHNYMAKHGISQADVVQATGICQSSVSLFLSGKRGLNADATLKILRLLSPLKDVSGQNVS